MRDWQARNGDKLSAARRRRYAENKKRRKKQRRGMESAYDLSRRHDIDTTHRRKREQKLKAGSVTVQDLKDIYKRDGGRCVYCGAEVTNVRFHAGDPRGFDHFIPLLHADGKHEPWNLGMCCPDCNYLKGQRTLLEFDAEINFPKGHFAQLSDRAFGLGTIYLDDD